MTKRKEKTEVYPFWKMEDIRNVVEWFENNQEWDGYLITMLELLLGRRIGDTVMMKWSDLYYENGSRKREINTIEEQKTGKVTNLPISNTVFEALDKYLENVDVNIKEHYNEYIFEYIPKTNWLKRKNSDIYSKNDVELWCIALNKTISEDRKEKIIKYLLFHLHLLQKILKNYLK